MISYIACDNLDQVLGKYFHDCALECKAYIEDCIDARTTIITIEGAALNQVNIDFSLEKKGESSFIFVAYSHGDINALKAAKLPYVKSNENTYLFKGGLVYTNACLAAQELGPDLISKGAFAFVGYSEEVTVPYDEKVKKICMKADNYALVLFLNGTPIGEAVKKSKDFLTQQIVNFEKFSLGSQLTSELIEIRDAMKVIGNKDLTISNLIDANTFPDTTSYHKDDYNKLKNTILSFKNNPTIEEHQLLNENVIEQSIKLLDILYSKELVPTKISDSCEGSIIWEFLKNNVYYLIEIYNDGYIVFLRRDADKRTALDLTFKELEEQVIGLLNG